MQMFESSIYPAIFTIPIFENTLLFFVTVISLFALIGIASRYFVVALFLAFLIYVLLATETDHQLLMTGLYSFLIGMLSLLGVKTWSFVAGGEDI